MRRSDASGDNEWWRDVLHYVPRAFVWASAILLWVAAILQFLVNHGVRLPWDDPRQWPPR